MKNKYNKEKAKMAKQRYFRKTYRLASKILCGCGCGVWIKSVDKYARPKKFVNGHNGRKYEDPRQYKIEWIKRNKKWLKDYKRKYHQKLKVELILFLGGICKKCDVEYNGKNGAIFEFHHINPKKKKFAIGNMLRVLSKKTILKEVKKCDLLCSNCHNLVHSSEF